MERQARPTLRLSQYAVQHIMSCKAACQDDEYHSDLCAQLRAEHQSSNSAEACASGEAEFSGQLQSCLQLHNFAACGELYKCIRLFILPQAVLVGFVQCAVLLRWFGCASKIHNATFFAINILSAVLVLEWNEIPVHHKKGVSQGPLRSERHSITVGAACGTRNAGMQWAALLSNYHGKQPPTQSSF